MSGWIGRRVPRVEDERLLRGEGRFADDVAQDGEVHAAFVRSPHAHAVLRGLDAEAARAMPGVLAVLSARELEADGVRPLSAYTRDPRYAFRNADGSEMADPHLWPLVRDKVRHVGEAVAMVVAETRAAALDAAEAVAVEWEPLGAVTDAEAALAPGAPQVREEGPGNLAFDWRCGDAAAAADAFARAAHVVERRLHDPRLIVAFLEPRSAMAHWPDGPDGRCRLRAPCQGTHRFRDTLSESFGIPRERFHILADDVGGGFGPRGFLYPEILLTVWAARRVGRPLRWVQERGEGFLTDLQARDQTMRCALALDPEGKVLALRVDSLLNLGAHIPARAVYAVLGHMGPIATGVYDIPALDFRIRGVFTNCVPVYALRGVGRAEDTHVLETLMDEAAAEAGLDRLDLRRRNLVPQEAMPYASAGGSVYDSGDFAGNMAAALEAADWAGFAARRADSARRGVLRGIGFANYLENAGAAPSEFAEIKVRPEGRVDLLAGTQASGQGHRTVYAQVAADALGLPFESLAVHYGDSDAVRIGYGSMGSRSMVKAGAAIIVTAQKVIEAGRVLAADMLEAAQADIAYGEGAYVVAGTDRRVTLFAVAAEAERRGAPLSAHEDHRTPETFPNGAHVAEVEVDPATGEVRLLRHVLVQDVGRAVNPLILEGQMHGGAAQGIGQAAVERTVYEEGSGQLLSASFLDYAIPRADEMPDFATIIREVPSPTNPLGAKGAGEGGTTGAMPAVMNAVRDALRPLAVPHLDPPVTPERVWRALREAAGEQAPR